MQIRYSLSTTSGYKLNIAKTGEHVYDDLAYYHKNNFPDVKVTRPNTNTDMSLLHNKCLLSVNGYIYPTSYVNDILYIPKATISMLKTKDNHVGILSFNQIEENLIKTSIQLSMVTPEVPISMYEKSVITFNRPIGHCFLVLAGYLIFEHPEFFYRVSDRSFVLRLDRLNYVEKLYELSRYRNIFEELAIPVSPLNPLMFEADIARSDSTISKFLTLNNSFLVEVPSDITTKQVYLEHSNIPGTFRTEIQPVLPLITGFGKLSEYQFVKANANKYTIHTVDAYRNNYLFTKLQDNDIRIFNNNRIVGRTYDLSKAFFLDIRY